LINHEGLTACTKNTKTKNSKKFFVIFVFVAKRPPWFVLDRSEPRAPICSPGLPAKVDLAVNRYCPFLLP